MRTNLKSVIVISIVAITIILIIFVMRLYRNHINYVKLTNTYEFIIPEELPVGLTIINKPLSEKSSDDIWEVIATFEKEDKEIVFSNLEFLTQCITAEAWSFEDNCLPKVKDAFEKCYENQGGEYLIPWHNRNVLITNESDKIIFSISWYFLK